MNLQVLRELTESPCPLVVHPADAEPLKAAGLIEYTGHRPWSGALYQATDAGRGFLTPSSNEPR